MSKLFGRDTINLSMSKDDCLNLISISIIGLTGMDVNRCKGFMRETKDEEVYKFHLVLDGTIDFDCYDFRPNGESLFAKIDEALKES